MPKDAYRSIGWLRIEQQISWGHRLTVSVPMAALGIFDNLVALLTLGYVQPGLALAWGFRQSLYRSRQLRASGEASESS